MMYIYSLDIKGCAPFFFLSGVPFPSSDLGGIEVSAGCIVLTITKPQRCLLKVHWVYFQSSVASNA